RPRPVHHLHHHPGPPRGSAGPTRGATLAVTPQDPNLPDDRDLDDGGLDLTPRETDTATRRRGIRRYGAIAALVILVLTIGGVAWAARDSSLFYRNADEAIAERDSLGTKRF